jgi:Zn-dependent M28 family amino/carboxypeptidase
MARFFGRIGYGAQVEAAEGVWVDEITERSYYGDVVRNARNLREGENLNFDLSVQNSISIVADAYANEHFFAIRYVEWSGVLWTVTSVEVQSPRLLLRLGEVYNGPTPAVAPTP